MSKSFKSIVVFSIVFGFLLFIAGCGQDAGGGDTDSDVDGESEDSNIKIGLSVVDLTLERWQHDRDIFVQRAEELGAEVLVQSADGNEENQLSQIQNMLSQGVDAIVIIAVNSDSLSPVVDQAVEEGVKVIAYDRMVNNSEIDAFVSFDNERVGEMQAEYIVEQVPSGNYFLLGGSPVDNNAHIVRDGQMNILEPLIDDGDITVVGDQWADNWSTDEALEIVENGLTANNNNIDAVVASNDSTANGAIQALSAQNLAGEVIVSGQDADLSAIRRIAEGTQAMTVYKPIQHIATTSAEVAVQLVKGESPDAEETMHNGMIDVPFVKLDPISVTKDNLLDTVIEDGFHSYEDVYQDIPEDERPEKPE